MKRITLPHAPEPKWLKEQAQTIIKETSDYNTDSYTFWGVLPSYLYTECGWGKVLNDHGISWNSFQRHMSSLNHYIGNWVKGIYDWKLLEGLIIKSIKQTF